MVTRFATASAAVTTATATAALAPTAAPTRTGALLSHGHAAPVQWGDVLTTIVDADEGSHMDEVEREA